jgi:TPR repeat protein
MLKTEYSSQDIEEARSQALRGDALKQAELTLHYLHVEKNLEEASIWLKKLCDSGASDIQFACYQMHTQFVEDVREDMRYLFLLAALNGSAPAQNSLGLDLIFGAKGHLENKAVGYIFLFASLLENPDTSMQNFYVSRAKEDGFSDDDIAGIKAAAPFFKGKS